MHCISGKLTIVKENRRGLGLASVLTMKCCICDATFLCGTQKSENVSSLNTAAVWGTFTSGSSYNQTRDYLSTLDIPAMNYDMFTQVERKLSTCWKEQLWELIEKAGKE